MFLLIIFGYIFANHFKTVYFFNDEVIVKYFIFKKKSFKFKFNEIKRIELAKAQFNTPNISILLINKKKRLNFEFGSNRNFLKLINLLSDKEMKIIDNSNFIISNYVNQNGIWKIK